MPLKDRPGRLALGLLAAAVFAGWQWMTVHANYGGNWTALYCTGARRPQPASLAPEHIWLFPDSDGYDGQMYHYIAHDPSMRNQNLRAAVDDPRLRYRRILLPALAYVAAAGHAGLVDPAYYILVLLFIAAGVYWSAAGCLALGRSALWGLLFALLPATLIGIDRMVVDVALAALTAGFACHVRAPSWRLFAILAAAALTRETGLLLIAGYAGYLALARQWKRAAVFSLAALPAFAWYGYVAAHTIAYRYSADLAPFTAIWRDILHPLVYPAGLRLLWLARVLDYVALAGILTAFVIAVRWNLPPQRDPFSLAMLSFVALAVIYQRPEHWLHVYDYGRVYSPVLLLLGFQGLRRHSWLAILPLSMMLPRIGMQFGAQVLGALHALI